jgi:hypothetical protein
MSMMTEWLLAIIVSAASPERAATEDAFPGWAETVAERKERFTSIASDLEAFVFDEKTRPVFGGDHGRARTAALVLAVAYHESGFMKDVDIGPCYRGKSGQSARCDSGKSACLMQIRIADGKTPEGYTREELFKDRRKCFEAGLRLLRSSLGMCKHLPLKHRLAAYASGSCDKGLDGSERLMALADKFTVVSKMPGKDAQFIRHDKKGEKK